MLDKIMRFLAPVVLVSAATLLIMLTIKGNRSKSLSEHSYIKVNTCIASVPTAPVSAADIEKCYKAIEQETGNTLKRYYVK